MRYRLPIFLSALMAALIIARASVLVRQQAARRLFIEKVMDMHAGSVVTFDTRNGYGDD